MHPEQLVALQRPESSAVVAARILTAWERSLQRNAGLPNASLRGERLLAACALDTHGRAAAESLGAQLELTGRGVHRLLRVARTIADLRAAERVAADDLAAAASLRERTLEQEVAA
jgi:magnesium chelatase family protein